LIHLLGPSAGDDLSAVRAWIDQLDLGRREDRRYTLTWQTIGGRHIGRNQIPVRAVVATYPRAWALLGVADMVACFDRILTTVGRHPAVRDWAVAQPHRALDLSGEMAGNVAAYERLNTHRGSNRYLREISAPGVDTKFAERHRSVLAAILGVSGAAGGFLADLGLRTKPELVRIRPAPGLGLPPQVTEVALRSAELAQLPMALASPSTSRTKSPSVDVPHDAIVIWSKGFEVDRVGRLPWLANTEVVYWGDIGTHGFAILDRLRAWLPQTRSILMDLQTLLAHRERWATDDRPASSALRRLTTTEHELYTDLVGDVFGRKVRLEQERIDWGWVNDLLKLWAHPPGDRRRARPSFQLRQPTPPVGGLSRTWRIEDVQRPA
jgi:hypothetical protein